MGGGAHGTTGGHGDVSYDGVSGEYYNAHLCAPNVWCIDVQPAIVAEVAELFERCELRAAHARLDVTKKSSREQVRCHGGEKFFCHHAGWSSDVGWCSADDQPTHDLFLSIFERMGLAKTFGPVISHGDGGVHLYSAFFVVRTSCTAPDLHVDYGDAVKTHALTLMTPLYEEYSAVEDFQLLYTSEPGSKPRRYRYKLGEAIVFGAGFVHSTEPGVAPLDDSVGTRRAHAYLCFAFGSDREEHWSSIAETIDGNQTRQISRPAQLNGAQKLSLSKLGLRIEAGTADDECGTVGYGQRELSRTAEAGEATVSQRRQARRPRGILK